MKHRGQAASAAGSVKKSGATPKAKTPSVSIQDPENAAAESGVSQTQGLGWELGTRVAVLALALMGGIWFLSWARPIVVPITAAILIGMILGPISDRLKRFGVPRFVTNLFVLTALALAGYGVAAFFVPTIADWITRLPEQVTQIREKFGFVQQIIEQVQIFERLLSGSQPSAVQAAPASSGVTTVIAAVSPAFAELFVFAFTLIFFMLGRNTIKQRVVLAVRGRDNRLTALRILADIERRLLDHFAIISVINFGVAIVTTLMLFALDFPSAPVWGFLAFVLNFLPVIGPLVLKALLLGTGVLVMPTLTLAVLPVIGYILITSLESNLITPNVIGRRITVDPLLIFVTICFLTWLWGPVGALLSLPMLNVAMIVTEHLWGADELVLPG